MFHRHRWLNWFASFVFVAALASCDSLGSGCGCAMGPLPGDGLPSDQTLEGGAQMRVTPSGFDKVTGILDGFIDDALAGGFCIPEQRDVLPFTHLCSTNDGMCTPGCEVDASRDSIVLSALDADTLRADIQFDGASDIHVDLLIGSCTLDVTIVDGVFQTDIGIGIDELTGELTLELENLEVTDLDGLEIDGCLVGELLEFLVELFANTIADQLEPVVAGFLTDFLPDPLGIANTIDVGDLIGLETQGGSPNLEVVALPGGYATLETGGISLGVILGLNSDADPSTRETATDSEPSRCVPPLPTPDYSADPGQLASIAARHVRAAAR